MALSQRQLQVGELVKRSLSAHLHELEFYGLPPLAVTLMEVRMSPDLKLATAYIVPAPGLDEQVVLQALKDSAFILQKHLSKDAKLRATPKLRFIRDDTFEQAWAIEELLRK
jgi:ribosome-binding factor A